MTKVLWLCSLLLAPTSLCAQFTQAAVEFPSSILSPSVLPAESGTRKSRKLVFFYSLVVPGAGDLYLKDWKVGDWTSGKYFFGMEVALWSVYLYASSHSGWIRSDARAFAAQHAGVDWSAPKPKDYSTYVGKFADLYTYNETTRRLSGTEFLYEETEANYWRWDTESNRRKYDRLRISSQQSERIAQYLVFGFIVNRIMAAVNSAREYRRLAKSGALGFYTDFRPVLVAGERVDWRGEAGIRTAF